MKNSDTPLQASDNGGCSRGVEVIERNEHRYGVSKTAYFDRSGALSFGMEK
jgi:hypothetical protein